MARARRATENPARSIRVDTPTWEKAIRRAEYEGTTVSAIVQMFVKGYGDGLVNPPQVHIVYAPAPPTATSSAPASVEGSEH